MLVAGACCWVAAGWIGGADPGALSRWSQDLVRPLALPFLWRQLRDAEAGGDPAEAFARARQLLTALPGWADGYTVFAYRYVLDGGDPNASEAARAEATRRRLELALTFLEEARPTCGPREDDLLVAASFLVELAARNEPGLAATMAEAPAIVADRLLAEAERVGGGASVREQRVYFAPQVAAALLRGADHLRAIEVLRDAAARCDEVRDRERAADWQRTLRAVAARLAGDRTVDPEPLLADPRLVPLHPFLR